jgi:hypothetical protein
MPGAMLPEHPFAPTPTPRGQTPERQWRRRSRTTHLERGVMQGATMGGMNDIRRSFGVWSDA